MQAVPASTIVYYTPRPSGLAGVVVNFRRSPATPSTYDPATGVVTAYVESTQLPYYVDLLRNEKPVYLHYDVDVTPPVVKLRVGREPTGEGGA